MKIQRAQAFTGKHNADWKPYIATFDKLKIPDMPFCLVPVGSFQMGCADNDINNDNIDDDEKYPHQQQLDQPYWIAQYPVTNAQWKMGVEAYAVNKPEPDKSLEWYEDSEMENAPVTGINGYEARKFAEWVGCRLPEEIEWAYAGRGIESWQYPWGNEWQPDHAVWTNNSGDKPAPITTKPEGQSWVGAYHMSGNVWEWMNTIYKHYPYTLDHQADIQDTSSRVLRGGSFYGNKFSLRLSYRTALEPNTTAYNYGLRLAISVSATP